MKEETEDRRENKSIAVHRVCVVEPVSYKVKGECKVIVRKPRLLAVEYEAVHIVLTEGPIEHSNKESNHKLGCCEQAE